MDNTQIFSAMQEGKPYKSYIKTVISKVYVSILDPFDESPSGILLYGDHKKGGNECIVDAWNPKQDGYIKRMNKPLFDDGLLIEYKRPENVVVERTIEEYSDDELLEIINRKWYAFSKVVKTVESPVVLNRMIEIARDEEKSEKYIKFMETKLSELQLA